jgi:hypothetical protein
VIKCQNIFIESSEICVVAPAFRLDRAPVDGMMALLW